MARIPLEYMGEQEVGAKRWGRVVVREGSSSGCNPEDL